MGLGEKDPKALGRPLQLKRTPGTFGQVCCEAVRVNAQPISVPRVGSKQLGLPRPSSTAEAAWLRLQRFLPTHARQLGASPL